MNKYIRTDLQDATTNMKVAIMNALNDINKGEETYINLGKYISHFLFIECLEKAGWKPEKYLNETINVESCMYTPSNKIVIVTLGPEYILSARKTIEVTLSMTLSSTQKIEVPGDFDQSNDELLQKEALAQMYTPEDALMDIDRGDLWTVDDVCVV